MELTTKEIDQVDEAFGLKDYTKSHYFAIGIRLVWSGDDIVANDSFERGAKNNSCVCCMFFYSLGQGVLNNFHLIVPMAIESAIRGHLPSMRLLADSNCYGKAKPAPSHALPSFWTKMMNEITNVEDKKPEVLEEYCYNVTEKERKENKKDVLNHCFVCSKKDTNERTFNKCGICKQYSYCGKECQSRHWKQKTGNHMAECRHLMILKEYFKPRYAREIRDAIIAGDDPKTIVRLQTLRTHLGLNRPKGEYEELFVTLCAKDKNDTTKNEYLTARNDGTVWIGSSPNMI